MYDDEGELEESSACPFWGEVVRLRCLWEEFYDASVGTVALCSAYEGETVRVSVVWEGVQSERNAYDSFEDTYGRETV